MNTCLDPSGSCTPGHVVVTIIDGEPWTASRIRHPHLRQHCRQLGRTFRQSKGKPNLIVQALREPCHRLFSVVVSRSTLFESLHPSEFPLVPGLVRIAGYSGHWHRQPEDWYPEATACPHAQWRSLLRHLFSRGYLLPEFFDSAWLVAGSLSHIERDWYCHVVAGFSFRKAKGLPESISSRALYLAMQAPSHLTIRRALRWGQVKALGGSQELIEVVMISQMALDFCSDRLWLRLIAKVVCEPAFESADFGMIVDYLWIELRNEGHTRAHQLVAAPLQELLNGSRRFWSRLLKQMLSEGVRFRMPDISRFEVRRELDRIASGKWALMPQSYRNEVLVVRKAQWSIHQLDTHLQLISEGRIMKHCVGNYRKKCEEGRSVIFSFRIIEEGAELHLFTVEVNPETRRICQIRNRWNHLLSIREVPVVWMWAARNRISIR